MIQERVLCVDDESNVLVAYQRNLRKKFAVEVAPGPNEGLAVLERNGPFAVVVSDMRMPVMNGVEFLLRVKQRWPDTVRMVLTGNADVTNAIESVNQGNIFRFLTKPCPSDQLATAIHDGITQYQLIKSERELLEHTLNGSIKTLSEILSIVSPESFSFAVKLRSLVKTYAEFNGLRNSWELELAAVLSDIGFVSLPPEVVVKSRSGQALSDIEEQMLDRVPEIGHNLLANIPRMDAVARIILYHKKQYNGHGFPIDSVKGPEIPAGARILKVLSDLSLIESRGKSRAEAMLRLRQCNGWYDPATLDSVEAFLAGAKIPGPGTSSGVPVNVMQLRIGQVLVSNIKLAHGQLLVGAGQEITEPMLERIWNFSKISGIQEPILIAG